METKKVDQILQYTLALAAQEDDIYDRQLGPIHLIKYVYLADLAYATVNNGQTYTGVNWQFYHYGPWAETVWNQLDPALSEICATQRTKESPTYDKDIKRWYLDQNDADEILNRLAKQIPPAITMSLKRDVHKFTKDTTTLLHHVYLTKPMLRTRPHDFLDFSNLEQPARSATSKSVPGIEQVELSKKRQKKIQEERNALRKRIQEKLEQKKLARQSRQPSTCLPRYDDVFFNGLKWLDSLAGEDIGEFKAEVRIDDSVWSLPGRDETDVP
jgi:hypothetical protein